MVGDSVGLPFEGLGRSRVEAMLNGRPLSQRLLFGHGMVSDDTEHALLTAVAWSRSAGEVRRFSRELGRLMRWWAVCLPPGTGLATARACARLVCGVPPERSGVPSAGNGPVMRAGVLGLLCKPGDELGQFIRVASAVTHTDPRAVDGAMAIAVASRLAASDLADDELLKAYQETTESALPNGEMSDAVRDLLRSVAAGESTAMYAAKIGCGDGVSGFVMHTVPVVLHAWLAGPSDFRAAVTGIVLLGGDTDTTAATLGGLLGARNPRGIPMDWFAKVCDFPTTPSAVLRLADRAAAPDHSRSCGLGARWVAQPIRNCVFLIVVLAHGFRRFLPPYG